MAKQFRFEQWSYNSDNFVLTHQNGVQVQLEPRLGRLLQLFCAQPHEVLLKERIIEAIWAPRVVSDESLTVAISQLRKHFKRVEDVDFIKTVPGRGYIWKPATECVESKRDNGPQKKSPRSLMAFLSAAILLIATFAVLVFWSTFNVDHDAAHRPQQHSLLEQAHLALSENEDPDLAIRLYRQVLTEDAQAEAYLGLARARLARIAPHEMPQHADELVSLLKRSLDEDASLAGAQWLLGMVYFYGHWDFGLAYQTLIDEFEAGNRQPQFLLQFSEVMLALGEAGWVERATHTLRELHPEYYTTPTVAWLHLLLGDTNSAQREIERIIQAELPNYGVHVSAQQVAFQAGDMATAWEHLKALMELDGIANPTISHLQSLYDTQGLSAVHAYLQEDPLSSRLGHYRPPLSLARHAIIAGNQQQALAHIEEALEIRQWEVLWLLVDPHYSPLYDKPGFIELSEKFHMMTGAY